MRIILLTAAAMACAMVKADVSAVYGEYGPTGNVAASAPRISWKVSPTGGGHVSHAEMRINDRSVAARFNGDENAIEFTPDSPLRPGRYSVACRVTIEHEVVVRQDWSFEVGLSSTGAARALDAINEARSSLGMPLFRLEDRMSAAAAAHSVYQSLNRLTCHVEEPGKPGYTAANPWDRTRAFGYPGACFEGACGGQNDERTAIRMLFDAPYHRIPFLQPGSPDVGIGIEGDRLTVDYAVSQVEGAGLSPAPGQTGVPVLWDGNESPSPLTVHGASGTVGYPIVFGWFTPRLEGIRVISGRLTDANGNEIGIYLNTPENDPELRSAAILTPRTRLAPNTGYTATVKATTQSGRRIDRTWTFTTGP